MKEVYRFVVLWSETLRAGTDLHWRKWKFWYILISSPRCISCCFKIFTIATSRSMSSWLVGRIQPIIIYICQFGRVRKIACLLALLPSFSSRDSCLPRTQTFVERRENVRSVSCLTTQIPRCTLNNDSCYGACVQTRSCSFSSPPPPSSFSNACHARWLTKR